jgi:hypothetical protein
MLEEAETMETTIEEEATGGNCVVKNPRREGRKGSDMWETEKVLRHRLPPLTVGRRKP